MNLLTDELKVVRQHIHQHPELSGFETETAGFLLQEFKKLNGTEIIEEIGGNGFLVVFDSRLSGPSLLFRAELDGLPIQETSSTDYKSIYNGKGHQCGHDGHMTILLGLGNFLSKYPMERGKVSLLFQPAEETGEGAAAVIHDAKFKDLYFDEVFALHNLPGYGLGSVVLKDENFNAAVRSIIIHLNGKTAHAAEPENGLNPALAVADILQKVEVLNNNQAHQPGFKLVTPVHVKVGEPAYGVSAGHAEVHYTYRCWSNENLEKLEEEILAIATAAATKHHLTTNHQFLQTFYANENDVESVDTVRTAAKNQKFKLIENKNPFKWGEDFGFFTRKYKGCLFGLGSGVQQPALHHPDYDFPDELLEYGVNIFKEIIKLKLSQ